MMIGTKCRPKVPSSADPRFTDKQIRSFWSYVALGGLDQCWPWLKSCNEGYGQFHTRLNGSKKRHVAHRLAFELATGTVLTALEYVLHSCDNPPCCNPCHMFLGDARANILDCKSKGRNAAGEKHGCHVLTEQQVREIRSLYAAGGVTQVELANRYGVSFGHLNGIISRKRWSHVE